MKLKIKVYKLLLATIGKILPLRSHFGGKISNRIRCFITKGIIQQMGENCIVEKGAEIMEGCVFGDCTGIGPNSMIGPNTIFKGHSMMGPNVHIYTTGHYYDKNKHCFSGRTGPDSVIIGKNVWLGYGVIVLPGVTIGNNVIIGAGSVVTKDIPNGVLAAGNPCIVKKVIDKEIYEGKSEDESIPY